MKQSIKWFVI